MRALNTKIIRDLGRRRGQFIAVSAVVAVGIATFVTMWSAHGALVRSQAAYYDRYRFGEVFAGVKRAPESVAARLRAIPGVAVAETRLVFEVTVDVPGLAEPATGRLISAPATLNRVHLRQGRMPQAGGSQPEAVISEAFAVANRLSSGDSVQAVLNGRWRRLRIVGVGISPEYVYELRGASFFPDSRRFGVLWMHRDTMAAAFDMTSAFNEASLALEPGAREAEVVARADALLEDYGCLGSYGRDEQLSHRFLSDEIKQDRITGIVVPAVFLAIAAFLTNIVLSRMAASQRDQIATLKAFGYSNATIGLHYVKLALVPVVIGTAGGIAIGAWAGHGLARVYADFFRFPALAFTVEPMVMAASFAISAAAGIGGVALALRSVVALPPAEAMNPAPPARYSRGMVERLGLVRALPLVARMIVRGIERRPVKSLLSVAGMAMAISVLLVGRYFFDAITWLIHVQFDLIQRENAIVTFVEPRSPAANRSLERMPGVLRSEPFRVVPVRFRNGYRAYRIAIQGIPADHRLHALLDTRLRPIALPEEGLALTRKLAEILGVRPGDELTVEVLEGRRPARRARVAAQVDEWVGLAAYMELGALNRLLREGKTQSGAWLAVDPRRAGELYAALKRTPAVNSVAVREAMLASFEETIARSIRISTTTLSLFAYVIALSIVYNSIRIALSERSHELASLRVLGFTRGEVTAMLLGEHAVLTAASIPVGFLLGRALCETLARAMESELYRMPVILSARSYVLSVAVIVAAAVFSGILAARGIRRLDLIGALKTRE